MPTARSTSNAPLALPTRQRITRNLSTLNSLYSELTHALTRPRFVVEKVREQGAPGISLNAKAVEIRWEIRTILAGWAAMVCEERQVTAPRRTTAALTEFLNQHAGWLSEHITSQDVVTETDDLVKAAWSVLSGRNDHRLPMGSCARTDCEGELVAIIGDAVTSGPATVVCSADSDHAWTPDAWDRLRASQPASRASRHEPARVAKGLTAQEIALGWGIAPGTVYWMANTHRWGRSREGRRVLYARNDVIATMESRSADMAGGRPNLAG